MDVSTIRRRFVEYYIDRGHKELPPSGLVPSEDPTTLFNGSGMQPLVPYLLGDDHPLGDRLVNSQPCFRAEDIDQIGDERHTTFFEMLGNWSLGAYYRREQLLCLFNFLMTELRLDPARLYATVFRGDDRYGVARDAEAEEIWRHLFDSVGVQPIVADMETSERASEQGTEAAHILLFDSSQNWWSRSGPPESMPVGEPGGPDSEIFYEFPEVEHDPKFGTYCHVHCECGRFVEIGNSVFMQYARRENGFDPLPRRNVDFGAGLERFAMAANDSSDVFALDGLRQIVEHVQKVAGTRYEEAPRPIRIIADHARAVVFLAANGVEPSNTQQGYVMRRFVRRLLRQALLIDLENDFMGGLVPVLAATYGHAYPEIATNEGRIAAVLEREEAAFRRTLSRGTREFAKVAGERLTGQAVFKLFDTYGFPPELSIEEAARSGVAVDPAWSEAFDSEMTAQRERSRSMSAGIFRGGLADGSERTTRLHTATHLLYKALRTVLGDHVVQRGSNITPERLRFDFSHSGKLTLDELQSVEEIVNGAIDANLPVSYREMTPDAAFAEGALGAFGDRYGSIVKVYIIGDADETAFSTEICGGPHVAETGQLGRFKILKEESASAGVRRIRATASGE